MSKKLTTQEFIIRAKEIHGNKYDYSETVYKNQKTKIKIICLIHGEFEQFPNNHLVGKGCFGCNGNKRKSLYSFIEEVNEIHNNKYDYSLVKYKNNETKVKIICPEHGIFDQKPSNHLMGKGCISCASNDKRDTKQDFILKAEKVHGNKYDYSSIKYKNSYTKIEIFCKKHDKTFMQKPSQHLIGKGCPICNESKGEKIISNYLNNNDIEFIPQYKFNNCRNINPLPFDFYLPGYNICIEYNGKQHYEAVEHFGGEYNLIYTQNNDKIKKEYCNNNNIKLLTIRYDEDIVENIQYEVNDD